MSNQPVAGVKSTEAPARPANPASNLNLKAGLTDQAKQAVLRLRTPRNGQAIR
jgi:hypothetical protein